MSRNSSGNYTLPAGNPVITDTVIESQWANSTLEDVGNELTNSLSRNGKGGMLAPLLLTDGTENLPSLSFTSDQNSGLYRAEIGDYRLSIQGADLIKYETGRTTVTYNVSTAVAGPDIISHRDSSTPAADDLLGRFKLDGENDASEQITYAQLSATLVDPADGTEDGSLSFWTMQDGTLTEVFSINNLNETTFNGDVNVAGDLTVEGDTTLEGSTTVNGSTVFTDTVNLGDAVTYDGADLATYIAAGGDPSNGVIGRRYWRIKWVYTAGTCVVKEIPLWQYGSGFKNGARWARGVQMPANSPAAVSVGPDNSNSNASDVFRLFDGNLANSVTFSRPGAGDAVVDIELDFGEGNAPTISSFQFIMQSEESEMSGFQIYSSSDAITWTLLSSMEATDWASNTVEDEPSPHFVAAYSGFKDSDQYAVFDASVETIPPVTGGGGGGALWTFDTTLKTADYTATEGVYAFCDTSSNEVIVTAPASPAVGDIFLARNSTQGNFDLTLSLGFGVLVDGESAFAGWYIPKKAGLIWFGGSVGWSVFLGQVDPVPF